MAAAKSSRVNRKYKTKYKVQNWREDERGLRNRGDVTIWLSEEAISAWTPEKNGLRGGQRRYSNIAILTALTLRVVFGLPLRQTEGFLDSLLNLMDLDLRGPDHTTLSRRNQSVEVAPLTRAHEGPIHLIVDSTGLKILGSGEWNAHKYKASKKRRDWRKLHIGVDDEGFIVAAELTTSSGDDASTVPDLLDQIEVPIRRFTADGAYDHRSIYERVGVAGTQDVAIVIPPRRSAVSAGPTEGPWAQREAALERIRQVGPTRVAEGVGLPPAVPSRERILPIQVSARGRPAGEEQQHAKERGHDRVSHPSTGWPNSAGRSRTPWRRERGSGKAAQLAPMLNRATTPRAARTPENLTGCAALEGESEEAAVPRSALVGIG